MFQSVLLIISALCLFKQCTMLVKYDEIDYCEEEYCEGKRTHTLCKFPKPGPSDNCKGYKLIQLSKEEIKTILDLHNTYRNEVALGNKPPQPSSSDMRQLYWDEELCIFSQRWADQCLPFETDSPHDVCKDSDRFSVGQNVATTGAIGGMEHDVFNKTMDWYNEIEHFDPKWVHAFQTHPDPEKKIGHYTQFVWSESYMMGCGRVIFAEEYYGKPFIFERIVCDYGPSGNYKGEPVYQVGTPCSQCPPETECSKVYKGLCAIIEEEKSITQPTVPSTIYPTPQTTPPPIIFHPTTMATINFVSMLTSNTTTSPCTQTAPHITTSTIVATAGTTTAVTVLAFPKPTTIIIPGGKPTTNKPYENRNLETHIGPLNKDKTFQSRSGKKRALELKPRRKSQVGVWRYNKCYCLDERKDSAVTLHSDTIHNYGMFITLWLLLKYT